MENKSKIQIVFDRGGIRRTFRADGTLAYEIEPTWPDGSMVRVCNKKGKVVYSFDYKGSVITAKSDTSNLKSF